MRCVGSGSAMKPNMRSPCLVCLGRALTPGLKFRMVSFCMFWRELRGTGTVPSKTFPRFTSISLVRSELLPVLDPYREPSYVPESWSLHSRLVEALFSKVSNQKQSGSKVGRRSQVAGSIRSESKLRPIARPSKSWGSGGWLCKQASSLGEGKGRGKSRSSK